jgi:hypothetical protein
MLLEAGDLVMLSKDYQACDDARRGPMQPGEAGIIIEKDSTSKPFHVRHLRSRATWWYMTKALSPFAAVRPRPVVTDLLGDTTSTSSGS